LVCALESRQMERVVKHMRQVEANAPDMAGDNQRDDKKSGTQFSIYFLYTLLEPVMNLGRFAGVFLVCVPANPILPMWVTMNGLSSPPI
jgi:hypothetical protein